MQQFFFNKTSSEKIYNWFDRLIFEDNCSPNARGPISNKRSLQVYFLESNIVSKKIKCQITVNLDCICELGEDSVSSFCNIFGCLKILHVTAFNLLLKKFDT